MDLQKNTHLVAVVSNRNIRDAISATKILNSPVLFMKLVKF